MMEMLVLFKDTVEFLKAKDIEVVASMVGEILTVQEAGGFQLNIAKWDDEFIRLWKAPCHTPASVSYTHLRTRLRNCQRG